MSHVVKMSIVGHFCEICQNIISIKFNKGSLLSYDGCVDINSLSGCIYADNPIETRYLHVSTFIYLFV